MSDRSVRSRAVVFGLLLGGGLLGLLLATQPWWTVPTAPSVTGNEASATLAGVLAGAAVAGAALAVLLRRTGRQILGVLLTMIGVGMVVTGWAARTAPASTTPFATGSPTSTGLQFAYAGTGLLVGIGGVLLTLNAHHWPARADRFARLNRAAKIRAEDDAGEVWKALDQGFDPTGPDATDPDITDPDPTDPGPIDPGPIDPGPSAPQAPGRSGGQNPYDR